VYPGGQAEGGGGLGDDVGTQPGDGHQVLGRGGYSKLLFVWLLYSSTGYLKPIGVLHDNVPKLLLPQTSFPPSPPVDTLLLQSNLLGTGPPPQLPDSIPVFIHLALVCVGWRVPG
jgi:hypothetical protein